jgi:hypothetical protein
MQKFYFSIRTRDGLAIARLMISGESQEQAERKLNQMYRFCEIVSCASDHKTLAIKGQNTFIEGVSSLLAKRASVSG